MAKTEKEELKCKYCGALLKLEDEVCPYCGKPTDHIEKKWAGFKKTMKKRNRIFINKVMFLQAVR